MLFDDEKFIKMFFADELNHRTFCNTSMDIWDKMRIIAQNEDGIYDCRCDRINFNCSEDDRPENQSFKMDGKFEFHSTVIAIQKDSVLELMISVRNYGSYYSKKDAGSSDEELEIALLGSEEDWKWAREKAEKLMERAKSSDLIKLKYKKKFDIGPIGRKGL